MLRLHIFTLGKDERGAVAPTVALSLMGLIAACGLAFDYSRMAGLDTELQNAADQAALAGVTQLDGRAGAQSRATAAVSNLVANRTRLANDGSSMTIAVPTVQYYQNEGLTNAATSDANANFIKVSVTPRTAFYALTPIVGSVSSGAINASAAAGVKSSICNTPPIYLAFDPTKDDLTRLAKGTGVLLLGAESSSHFGYLDNGSGGSTLKAFLSWDDLPGDCLASDGVTVKPGVVASVEKGFNTRFGEKGQCPNGGTCSEAIVKTSYPQDTCHLATPATSPCSPAIGNGDWAGQIGSGTRYEKYVAAHPGGAAPARDRRRLSVAVVPFGSFGTGGSGAPVTPSKWLDIFITEPIDGSGKSIRFYAEIIGESDSRVNGRRDVPYLIE